MWPFKNRAGFTIATGETINGGPAIRSKGETSKLEGRSVKKKSRQGRRLFNPSAATLGSTGDICAGSLALVLLALESEDARLPLCPALALSPSAPDPWPPRTHGFLDRYEAWPYLEAHSPVPHIWSVWWAPASSSQATLFPALLDWFVKLGGIVGGADDCCPPIRLPSKTKAPLLAPNKLILWRQNCRRSASRAPTNVMPRQISPPPS